MASERKKLVKKLDTAFSTYIRLKTPQCVLCGSRERLTAGHVFSRVAYSTRWLEANIATQCMSCNMRHEFDPYPFFNWYIRKFGKKAFDDLHKKFSQVKKYSNKELQDLIETYEKKSKKYKK